MGIWRFSMLPGLVPDRPRTCSRRALRSEDPVDRRSGDPQQLVPDLRGDASSPHRSRASTISAMNGARRLPAGPFNVAQITRSGSTTSGP